MRKPPKISRIVVQKRNYVAMNVPSLSRAKTHKLEFFADGNHRCECEAFYWAQKTKSFSRKCNHYKRNTIEPGQYPVTRLRYAIRLLGKKHGSTVLAWNSLKCLFPEHYRFGIQCRGCPLSPYWCNVHPIKHGPRSLRKPVMWKIQTALYSGRKKDAARMMRRLLRVVRALKEGN